MSPLPGGQFRGQRSVREGAVGDPLVPNVGTTANAVQVQVLFPAAGAVTQGGWRPSSLSRTRARVVVLWRVEGLVLEESLDSD